MGQPTATCPSHKWNELNPVETTTSSGEGPEPQAANCVANPCPGSVILSLAAPCPPCRPRETGPSAHPSGDPGRISVPPATFRLLRQASEALSRAAPCVSEREVSCTPSRASNAEEFVAGGRPNGYGGTFAVRRAPRTSPSFGTYMPDYAAGIPGSRIIGVPNGIAPPRAAAPVPRAGTGTDGSPARTKMLIAAL